MPADVQAQLRAISAGCKALGDRGLLNGARAAIRVEARPLTSAAQAAARARLPKSGGLNEQVASQRWSVAVLASTRTAGVRLKTTAPDTDQTDRGFVRKPLFGDRSRWYTQQIPAAAGWASGTVERYGPVLAASIGKTMDVAAAEVARAAGGS